MSELKRRIAAGEGVKLDFKHAIDGKAKIARTLVAFANTEGGSLLIGVKDNGKLVGVFPEEEYYMIEGAASMYCSPEVAFSTIVWEEEHHLILEIIVEKSAKRHKAKDEDGNWRYYVRIKDQTLRSNKILEKIWRLERFGSEKPLAFDDSTKALLVFLSEYQCVSLSKMYTNLPFTKKTIENLLARLVFWGVVEMKMTESGTRYCIHSTKSEEPSL